MRINGHKYGTASYGAMRGLLLVTAKQISVQCRAAGLQNIFSAFFLFFVRAADQKMADTAHKPDQFPSHIMMGRGLIMVWYAKELVATFAVIAATCSITGCSQKIASDGHEAGLLDGNTGGNWTGYGNTYGEQHFSPLDFINDGNVSRLALAWSYDLPAGNPMTGPLAIDGVLYTATGYSVVRAFDAATGKVLWAFDPKAPEVSGKKLRMGWGSRGLAYWNGKIIVGTHDGRLIALDAKTGKTLWNVMTISNDDMRFISGAPRVFDGKVIIGHGGADAAATRGYVTTYNADTGERLWRFWLVPGKPGTKDGDASDPIMEKAAATWTGEWWKHGGGGTVWNTFTYDKETDTILLGTGNGAPWNQRVRSPGGGDNLFLCSIVALDAKTGRYKWHYQFNPGETWDYNASMDMHLADLVIDGKPRKVVIEAPKNGFLYVIDRTNGKLISAEHYTDVTWTDGIDIASGRPREVPEARYPNGRRFILQPGPNGAHTWLPSAFSPLTKLVYLPVFEARWSYTDREINAKNWRFGNENEVQGAVNARREASIGSRLVAWDPVAQKEKWRVTTPGSWNGGVLTTGGNLAFQGDSAGKFSAYNAATGKSLWTFDAKVPVLAPPITYRAGDKQYVTVLSGIGTSPGIAGGDLAMPVDYRTQARRVLTFVIDGKARLPATPAAETAYPVDPDFTPDPRSAARGKALYVRCFVCHGAPGQSGGSAPDFARSTVPQSAEAFNQVVRQGILVPNGMPQFAELSDEQLADLRQHIRTAAAEQRYSKKH